MCAILTRTVSFDRYSGFLGDKLGNYKILAIFGVLVGGCMPFGILWLFMDHQNYISAQHDIIGLNNESFNSSVIIEPVIQQPYTFPLLVLFRLTCFYSSTSTISLIDACAMTICKKHNADFGRQKLWGNWHFSFFVQISLDRYCYHLWRYLNLHLKQTGNASMAVIPLICGALVDMMSTYLGDTW